MKILRNVVSVVFDNLWVIGKLKEMDPFYGGPNLNLNGCLKK